MEPEVKWRPLYTWLLLVSPIAVAVYGALIVYLTWPIQTLSVSQAGVSGDSFGLVNALFAGLAFAGVVITMLLQKEQLALQLKELIENRAQFSRTATAQEESARLSALSSLLAEYQGQLLQNEKATASGTMFSSPGTLERLWQEHQELLRRKNELVLELETVFHRNVIAAKT